MLDAFLRSYFWVFRLGVVFAAAYLLARTANVFVGEALRVPPSKIAASPHKAPAPIATRRAGAASSESVTAAFLERNLFKAAREDLTPKPEEPAEAERKKAPDGPLVVDDENCRPSALGARLLATFVSDEQPDLSVAVLRATKAEENPIALRPGDKVLETAELLLVDFGKIYVNNRGLCESLSLEALKRTPYNAQLRQPPVHSPEFGDDDRHRHNH